MADELDNLTGDLDDLDLGDLDLSDLGIDDLDLSDLDLSGSDTSAASGDSAASSEDLGDIDELLKGYLSEDGDLDLDGIELEPAIKARTGNMDEDLAMLANNENLLDLELKEALGRVGGSDIELQDGIEDFVKDVAVYSDDSDVDISSRSARKGSKFSAMIENISPTFLKVTMWILMVLVGGAIGLTIMMALKSLNLGAEVRERGIIIRQGASTANNANFMYVGSALELGDSTITLVRMNMSRVAVLMEFGEYIDMSRYDAFLTDNWGRRRGLDRSYFEGVDLSDTSLNTRMWFEPLSPDVESFMLTITDTNTQENSRTRFTFGQNLVLAPVKYAEPSIPVDNGDPLARVEISNAVFSSTGSQIGYALKWQGDDKVVLGQPGEGDYIRLIENGRLVTREAYTPEQYAFDDNTIIGRVDFLPVQSLENTVTLQFDNMYKKIQVNREIPLWDIFYTRPYHEAVLEVGPYELVLERGGVQIDKYILVLHAKDSRLEDVSPSSNRVQATLDVTMTARKSDGSSITLEPYLIRSAAQGTDIVFDGSEEAEFLLGIDIEDIYFNINSAYFRLPPASVEMNLSVMERQMRLSPENAIDFVKRAFERRLGYKSQVFEYHEMDRFTENVLNDRELMEQYRPSGEVGEYDTQVSQWFLDGDRFYCVVRETWRSDTQVFHRTHKVVAEYGDRGWMVTEDEIVPSS